MNLLLLHTLAVVKISDDSEDPPEYVEQSNPGRLVGIQRSQRMVHNNYACLRSDFTMISVTMLCFYRS